MTERSTTSRVQGLVDGWMNLLSWSTARKAVLVSAFALVFHSIVTPVAWLAAKWGAPGLVSLPEGALFLVLGIGITAALLVLFLVVAWSGSEGRWTVYLLVCVYGTYMAYGTSRFGLVSSGWLAVFPPVVLLVPIFFDQKAGRFAFAWTLLLLGTISVLELSGRIPFAPAMLMRDVDAQRVWGWYATIYILVFAVLVFTFLLVQLSTRARDTQQRRLEQAHQDLSRTSEQLARASDLISRYVAAQVAEQIFAGNYSAIDKHHRRKLTLFFSDIRGFGAMADRMEPEETSQLLNEYLSEMTAIVQRHGGTIDKFIGDALMVFFGAPMATDDRDHALRAVRMAIEMQERVRDLSAKWVSEGLLIDEPFQIRIGINSGIASVGNFGSRDRLDYTAIGRQVNLAARLQVFCEPGKVLLSHSTWALVNAEIACLPKGEIRVKGIHNPVKVYEVTPGERDDLGAAAAT